MDLRTSVEQFPGIGPARAKKLAKLGIETVGDVLRNFPRDYEDRRAETSIGRAGEEQPVCIRAMVAKPPRLSRIRRGLDLVKVEAVDHSGLMQITYFNQSYRKDSLQAGKEYIFYGRVERQGRTVRMTNPVTEPAERQAATGCILPVYPLTAGITNNIMVNLARWAVDGCAHLWQETLPADIVARNDLADCVSALRGIHFPKDFEELPVAPAKRPEPSAVLPGDENDPFADSDLPVDI